MKSKSLRFHFLLLYVFLAVISGIVVPVLCVRLSANAFRDYQIRRRQEDIENLADSLTRLYNEEGGKWQRRRILDILHPAPQWTGMKITLTDSNNNEIISIRPNQMMPPRRRTHESENESEHESGNEISSRNIEHITIKLGRVKTIGTLDIERRIPSGRFEFNYLSYLLRYTLAGALLTIIAACVFGFIVAGRLSRPVIRAIERTKKIAAGDYDVHEETGLVGIRELDALTKGVEYLGRSLSGQETLRRRLMTDVAHELRTPLTVAITQIEAIADGILDASPERLNKCVDEMKRLGELIGNVEALSRLEGEAVTIHKENTDMKKFLEYAVESFTPVFTKANIELSAELEDNIACEIDRDKFKHIIDNLMSNALRYTNSGGKVKVKLCRKNHDAVIEVSDTGIGISQEDLPNIFERFYRADESRTRVTGGSGVGLAIVKAAVDAHGGKITVESVKGEGSTFRIILSSV